MAVVGMDAPDQLIKVKVCPQYNFLIFCSPHPLPRISLWRILHAFGRPCIDLITRPTTATTSLLLRIHFSSIP